MFCYLKLYNFSRIILLFFLLGSITISAAIACSCGSYDHRSLCQLGEEANLGLLSNFMAVVQLSEIRNDDEYGIYEAEILEQLAGDQPTEEVEIELFGRGLSCAQVEFIVDGAIGVLVAKLDSQGVAEPTFCHLERSFFQLRNDTVLIHTFSLDTLRYTLEEYRTSSCVDIVSTSEPEREEPFTLRYSAEKQELTVIFENAKLIPQTSMEIYGVAGDLRLKSSPFLPVDLKRLPPGLYAIVVRNDQELWTKSFVKPN